MEVKKLTDFVSMGIESLKLQLPNGFINTVYVSKEAREKIYS